MRKFLLASIALTAAIAAPVPPITATGGSAFSVDFNGFSGDNPRTIIAGLTSRLNFSGFAFSYDNTLDRTRVDFQVEIVNTSGAPITASRVSGFGFNTNLTPVGDTKKGKTVTPSPNTVSGAGFDTITLDGNMPNGIGTVQICASDQNCSGGANGGVDMTQGSDTAYLSLFFTGNHSSVVLGDATGEGMYVRYQSIAGAGQTTSASGVPTVPGSPVPETSHYVVLTGGLALIGLQRYFARKAA